MNIEQGMINDEGIMKEEEEGEYIMNNEQGMINDEGGVNNE
jgi:hypothetical protein